MSAPTDGSITTPPPPPSPDSAPRHEENGQQHASPSALTSNPSPADPLPQSPPVETTYTKRLLPDSLTSRFPHGLITGEPRSTEQQAALDTRKAEILASMTAEQIEESYQKTAKKIQDVLQDIKEGNNKVDKDIEDAKKTREMERRAWLGMKKAADGGDI